MFGWLRRKKKSPGARGSRDPLVTPSGPPHEQWVPVEQAMPPHKQMVFVYELREDEYVDLARWSEDNKRWYHSNGLEFGKPLVMKPTHWAFIITPTHSDDDNALFE